MDLLSWAGRVEAAAYIRRLQDKDKRQRAAIEGYAKRPGLLLIDEYNDAAVSGGGPD
jgi:hypothetical protein